MKKNIFIQSIKYLDNILDKKQKTKAYSLLGIMFILVIKHTFLYRYCSKFKFLAL